MDNPTEQAPLTTEIQADTAASRDRLFTRKEIERLLNDRSRININEKDLFIAIEHLFQHHKAPLFSESPEILEICQIYEERVTEKMPAMTRRRIQDIGRGRIDYQQSLTNLFLKQPPLLLNFPVFFFHTNAVKVFEFFIPNMEEYTDLINEMQGLCVRLTNKSILQYANAFFTADMDNSEFTLNFFSDRALQDLFGKAHISDQAPLFFTTESDQIKDLKKVYMPSECNTLYVKIQYAPDDNTYATLHQITQKLSRKFLPLIRDLFNRKATEQLYYETIRYLPIKGFSDSAKSELHSFIDGFKRSTENSIDVKDARYMYILEGIIVALKSKLLKEDFKPEFLEFMKYGQYLFTKVNSGLSNKKILEDKVARVIANHFDRLKRIEIVAETPPEALYARGFQLNQTAFKEFNITDHRFTEVALNYADLTDIMAAPMGSGDYVLCLYRHIPLMINGFKKANRHEEPVCRAVFKELDKINEVVTHPDKYNQTTFNEASEQLEKVGLNFFNAYFQEKLFFKKDEESKNPLWRFVDNLIDFIRFDILRLKRPGFDSEVYLANKQRIETLERERELRRKGTGGQRRTGQSGIGSVKTASKASANADEERKKRVLAERKRREYLTAKFKNEISRGRNYFDQELAKHNYFPTQFEIQKGAKITDEAWNGIVKDYYGMETFVVSGNPGNTVMLPIKYIPHCRKLAKLLLSETENSLLLNRHLPRSRFNVLDLHDIGRQIYDRLQKQPLRS